MNIFPKKSLAIFSLTSCEGCQFELLSFYDHFKALLDFYDIKNFHLGQEDNFSGPFDVALIEGSAEKERDFKFLRKIRKETNKIVTIGSCAHMGGIQSERNNSHLKDLSKKSPVKSISKIIKVDYIIPGCPVSHSELVKCLIDIYWEKDFALNDLPVCFECRQNENECHLKNNRPCLGPITRGGCGSICINNNESCLGCRGQIDQANISKMRQILGTIIKDNEIENILKIYGNYDN